MDYTTTHLDVLVVDDTSSRFPLLRTLFASIPDISPFYAVSLTEVIHILGHNDIRCIIILRAYDDGKGYAWHRVLKDIKPELPILIIPQGGRRRFFIKCRRLEKEGIRRMLRGPLSPALLREAVFSAVQEVDDSTASLKFHGRVLFSPFYTEEKYALLKDVIDLLDHETKELVAHMLSVISDLPDNEYTGTLNDCVNGLFHCVTEALGFITARKRIESLIDITNSMKLGERHIPFPAHTRIDFEYESRKLLFIESSRFLRIALAILIDYIFSFIPADKKIGVMLTREGDHVFFSVTGRGFDLPLGILDSAFSLNNRGTNHDSASNGTKGLWLAGKIIQEEHGEIERGNISNGRTTIRVRLPAFSLRSSGSVLSDLGKWYMLPQEVVEKKARIMRTILLLEFPQFASDIDSLTYVNLLDHFRDEKRKKERQKYFYKLQEYTRYNPNGRTVLLVDDSLYVHYSIAPVLADHGYHIIDFAFNGVEAFNLYRIRNPALIILDVMMPVKSGIETAQDIYRQNPQAKILFISALAEYKPFLENIGDLFRGKRYALLAKPIRPAQLLEAINGLLSEERPVETM